MRSFIKNLSSRTVRGDFTNTPVPPTPPPPTETSTPTPSAPIDRAARRERFAAIVKEQVIPLSELRQLAHDGVPDIAGMRSLVWKLLLEYLPCDRRKWKSTLAAKRNDYEQFCEELIINPSKILASEADSHACTQDGSLVGTDVTAADHPLSVQDNSVWKSYFKDTDLLEQINRDVMRTHPDLQFFSGEGDATKKHQDDMRRALLLFAKLNPGLQYVQGMNELYAPLYYTFSLDPDPTMAEHAEADAFFCFVELISDLRDNFCQQLDNSGVGIKATIGKLNTMLSENDRELWVHLEQNTKVNPQFYAFRWITLLFTQEFDLPDLLRVWDSLLSSPNGRLGYVLTMCCGMLMTVRDELLNGDFAMNLKLLQRYPVIDVHMILGVTSRVVCNRQLL